MLEYQNVYITICCILIYLCLKISVSGFLLVNMVMFLYFSYIDNSFIFFDDNVKMTSAKASQEVVDGKKVRKVTVNPRKKQTGKKNEEVNETKSKVDNVETKPKVDNVETKPKVDKVETRPNKSHIQSSESIRKLHDIIFSELEMYNKWKTDYSKCRSIRSDSGFKL